MKQANLGLELTTKRTRKREFLDEMNRVVPWSTLVALIEPHSPRAKTGRPPFPIQTMLRIHFLQQWFSLSDPAMEEALFDLPLFRGARDLMPTPSLASGLSAAGRLAREAGRRHHPPCGQAAPPRLSAPLAR